jgi:hypothetical protein
MASLSNQTRPLHRLYSYRSASDSWSIASIEQAAPDKASSGPSAPISPLIPNYREIIRHTEDMKLAASLTQKTQRAFWTAKPSQTCLNKIPSLAFSPRSARKPWEKFTKHGPGTPHSCLLLILLFLFVVFRFCFSNSPVHHQWNSPIRSDDVFLSSSFLDCFIPNSPILGVLRSNTSLKPNWRRRFHDLNSASQSDPANVIVQKGGNASHAMNDILPGTTTKERFVSQQAASLISVNSDSISNEINESDL